MMLVYSVYFSYMSYTITGHISAWVGDTADIVAIVVFTALFGFVGLYVGSIRKPSAKTKK